MKDLYKFCRAGVFCLTLLFFSGLGFSQSKRSLTAYPNTVVDAFIHGFYTSLPANYSSGKKYPLLVFVHGSGELGDGSAGSLPAVLRNGPPMQIDQQLTNNVDAHFPDPVVVGGQSFEFIVLSPQMITQPAQNGPEQQMVDDIINYAIAHYRVDASKINLTGLSMGGFGTWDLAIKHPEEFAAIVPICGGGDTAEIWKLRNMPVWCFHGAKDSTVPIGMEQKMIRALQIYNPSIKFTIYPDAGHDSWTATYNNDSLYQWLLLQKRFSYKQAAINASLLKEYAGSYASLENDTVVISVDNNKLFAKTRNNRSFELKPASNTVFFIEQKGPVDVQFNKSAKGKVTGFIVYENKRIEYKRIRNL